MNLSRGSAQQHLGRKQETAEWGGVMPSSLFAYHDIAVDKAAEGDLIVRIPIVASHSADLKTSKTLFSQFTPAG